MNNRANTLTVSQVAEMCGVNPRTVRKWIIADYFAGVKRGLGRTSPYRIPREAVEAFVNQRMKELGLTPEDIG